MHKLHYKATNWKQYNQDLINRDSLAFWIAEEAIQLWNQTKPGNRRKPHLFSD
ncbi:Mobile element protein [Candidatus Enterovibrio altilux]|uniref:Mobile element protein n=1 Tax=Candidatus Enterovibrio altilux TaxID=1927128 RepID=A0A291BAA8_9GAMM|nr:Mobile element protein [Candidatus Enterovibrio luxaltus]